MTAAPQEAAAKPGFTEEAIPHLEAVFRFALRLTQGRTAEAEDLVQDTFLQAYRAWDTFTQGTNARAWLFTIARNRFLRGEERRGRRPELTEAELDAGVESLAMSAVFGEIQTSTNPERAFFDSFVDEEVTRAIDALPAAFREVVVLSDVEGMSYPEMAEVLDVPVGTVKSRLFRGRRLLQQALYQYALEMGYVKPKERS